LEHTTLLKIEGPGLGQFLPTAGPHVKHSQFAYIVHRGKAIPEFHPVAQMLCIAFAECRIVVIPVVVMITVAGTEPPDFHDSVLHAFHLPFLPLCKYAKLPPEFNNPVIKTIIKCPLNFINAQNPRNLGHSYHFADDRNSFPGYTDSMLTSRLDDNGQFLTGLDAPYGDLNFFIRPPRWDIGPHRHSYFQFLLVLSGELSVAAGGTVSILDRGMASLIPPGISHRLESRNGYRQLGINLIDTVPEDPLIKILIVHVTEPVILTAPILLELLPEIEDCSRLQTLVSIQKIRNRLEYILLTCVDMLKKQDGIQAFREKLMAYLREKLSEPLTLDDISRHLALSATHVERLSYLEFGCGALRLFHRLKIDRARMLLHVTDLPISEISDCLGFADQSYFSRFFKKYTSTSPLMYKKHGGLSSKLQDG
jgi:AraC-like DNA-binding protein